MILNGKTSVLGVIGDPIEHTLSPFIHNKIIKELSDNNIYVPFNVKKEGLEEAIKGSFALGIKGINVTIPHKEEVKKYLVEVDSFAEQIGAVNTLKYMNNGYKGFNTDVYGLLTSLNRNNIELKNKTVLLLGAGGAAKATAIMCASQGVKKLIIMNRTIKKAEELAYTVKKFYDIHIEIYPLIDQLLDDKIDICFQTTPSGMSPNINDIPIDNDDFYKKIDVAVDLIYNPDETRFLTKAKENGAKILNGLEMLFYQGVKAYEIWNEVEIPLSVQNKILLELKDYIMRGSTNE